MKEKDVWLAQYPTAMFGFTGLLLTSEHYPELEEVVRSLEPTKILLESDFPHLLLPAFKTKKFHTPYEIDEVARRIAFLHGKTCMGDFRSKLLQRKKALRKNTDSVGGKYSAGGLPLAEYVLEDGQGGEDTAMSVTSAVNVFVITPSLLLTEESVVHHG